MPLPGRVHLFEAILDVNLRSCWIGKAIDRFSISIQILDSIPFQDTGVQDLVEIDLGSADPNELLDFVTGLDGIVFAKANKFSSGKRLKMIVGTSHCTGCRALVDSESFLLSVRSLDNGWAQWRVLIDSNEKLEDLSHFLNEKGMEHRIVDMTKFQNWDTLTSNEELVLSSALNGGYYDFPKRIGVRELAKELSVSTAYISYTLRSGQKKAIQRYFGIKDR